MSDENETELPPLLGRHHPVPRRRWRWLLPLLVSTAAVALVAVVVTAVNRDDGGAPGAVIDRYLNAVERGDTVEAYGLLCDRFRAAKPFNEFASTIQIEKVEAGGTPEHKVDRVEEVSATERRASYTVRRREGDVFVEAALVRERDAWRICGFKTRGVATTTTVGG